MAVAPLFTPAVEGPRMEEPLSPSSSFKGVPVHEMGYDMPASIASQNNSSSTKMWLSDLLPFLVLWEERCRKPCL